MGIDNLDPNRAFEKIIDTEPKNRAWVLSVVINIIFGVGLSIMFYLYNQARDERILSERKLDIQVQANLRDNKDYSQAVLMAEKVCREVYEAKLDIAKAKYEKALVDKSEDLERDMRALRNEANKINRTTKQISNKIGL